MPKSINGNPAAALNLAMTEIPLPDEDADATKYEANQKQHLDNAGALQTLHTALTTRVTAVEAVDITENSRLNALEAQNASDASRLSAAEAANSAEEARLAVLEAQAANDPARRFQMPGLSGDKVLLNIVPGGTQAIPALGQFDIIIPAGKRLKLKRTRWGYVSSDAGAVPTLVIQGASGLSYKIPITAGGVSTEVAPNFTLADNSAGGTPLSQGIQIQAANDASASANLVNLKGIMSWLDLSIE